MNFRVIDTPGLQDTNRASSEIEKELAQFAKLAPHGVAAFVIVVPFGRITPEHEGAIKNLVSAGLVFLLLCCVVLCCVVLCCDVL